MTKQEWEVKILETICNGCRYYDNGECTIKGKEKCLNHWSTNAIYTQIVEPLEKELQKERRYLDSVDAKIYALEGLVNNYKDRAEKAETMVGSLQTLVMQGEDARFRAEKAELELAVYKKALALVCALDWNEGDCIAFPPKGQTVHSPKEFEEYMLEQARKEVKQCKQ